MIAVDYQDKEQLVTALTGAHTVMSLIANHLDPTAAVGKALVDVSVQMGVKRFVPSEWSAYVPSLT